MALIIKVLLENRLGKGQDSLLQAKPGYAFDLYFSAYYQRTDLFLQRIYRQRGRRRDAPSHHAHHGGYAGDEEGG